MPTKEMLEQRRAELSGARQALLEKRRKRITPVATRINTIPRRPPHEPAPASFTQQRLWFLQQMEPENTAYNETRAVHMLRKLDEDALKRALLEVMQRHEILRTNFVLSNGQVQQVIYSYEDAASRFALHEFDLQALPIEEQQAAASRCIDTFVRKPFNLAHDMLWHNALIKLGPQDTILVTVLHHILCDGWGLDIFDAEIGTLYEAYSIGKSSPLSDLAIQYADFAYWQQHTLTGEYLDQQLAYWQRILADPPTQQPFISDALSQASEGAKGARLSFSVPATTTRQLKALSTQEGVTLFMTLLATFQVLLYHYSGQTDILIGSPIANRTRPEFEPLIGCFINTLVLRTSLSGNPTVQELLQRVRETALGAYAHQDVPFEKLVEALSPERDLHRNPFFQVLFTFQSHQQQSQSSLPGDIAAWQVDAMAAKFDLDLMMWESEGELQGNFSYDSSFFAPSTVAHIQQHFMMLLSTIARASTQHLLDIPTQTEAEQQAIEGWNSTQTSYPEDSCIHHIFEAQAAQTPDAIAIIAGKQRITYRDLNHQANQLAHYLQKLQVGPGSLVGLYLERSPDMLVSLLAILKAGGAYVPLDIAAPPERIAFMLQDANIAVLVTEQRLQHPLFQEKVAHMLCLDSAWEQIERESTLTPAAQVTARDLAYVIYTSGSTGNPKGVLVPHQAVVNYNWTLTQRYKVTTRDRTLQFASICFDTAGEEIYCALFSGAAIVMRSDTYAPSIQEFYQLINETQITILDLPTAYWHEWAASLASSQALDFPRSIRLVIVGGEKVLPEHMAAWQQYAAKHVAVIVNSYGPTETTIAATSYDITGPTDVGSRDIPIGYPLANAQAYVLNPTTLQPVPIGAPGELCIAGTGLAWGYLAESAKTADRFIPNPFSKTPGTRLYKTGDLVRYRDDGNIEFRGRVDHQVKIRGYRIELGEIEHVLRRHPAVRESVVLALEGQPGEKQLVAFISPHENQQVETKALRELLKASLPSYMEPSAFFILAALPLNTNGKIDRRALAALSKQGATNDTPDDEAEDTPLEEILKLLWAEVLEVEETARHTNFFDAGGHSLQATRLLARIQDTLEVEIPLRFIFDAPTIAGFAQLLLQDPQRRERIEATLELLLSVAELSEDEVETMLQEAE
jgi:amino acid adenylation domain-containing protein